jgi:hypothetical protein
MVFEDGTLETVDAPEEATPGLVDGVDPGRGPKCKVGSAGIGGMELKPLVEGGGLLSRMIEVVGLACAAKVGRSEASELRRALGCNR